MENIDKQPFDGFEEDIEGRIKIRNLAAGDHGALLEMYDSFRPKNLAFGLPPECDDARMKWVANLEHERLNCVAEIDGKIVGHAAIIDVKNEDFCELLFFVHQDYRRRGIGSAIIAEICKRALSLGKRRIWLMVERDNIVAIVMLYNIGFRITQVHNVDYEMELDLESADAAIGM